MVAIAVTILVPMSTAAAERQGARESAPWDDRVVEYARFVERERGLRFEHPVPISFLDDERFLEALGSDAEPTRHDRALARREVAQLRALGLIAQDIDLIAAQEGIEASTTAGFYDIEKNKMFVRGDDLDDVDVRAVLVHELTHALQDQHFDLDRLYDRATTSGNGFAVLALVEGDASNVEAAYVGSLSRAEQDAYYGGSGYSNTPAGSDETEEFPAVLELFDSAPYVFGPAFVDFVRTKDGRRGIDEVFRHPPASEEQIVDPVAFERGQQPKKVTVPRLQAGERRRGAVDEFGALSLYVLLASRLDAKLALDASEGWGGGRVVGFTRGVKDCVRVVLVGDTTNDTREIGAALDSWASRVTGGTTVVESAGEVVSLAACDTGQATEPTREKLDAAITMLSNRNWLMVSFVDTELRSGSARCIADLLVVDAQVVPLLDKDELTAEEEALLTERAVTHGAACGEDLTSVRRGGS